MGSRAVPPANATVQQEASGGLSSDPGRGSRTRLCRASVVGDTGQPKIDEPSSRALSSCIDDSEVRAAGPSLSPPRSVVAAAATADLPDLKEMT